MCCNRVPAAVAQLVERVLGKDEVMGPNPISSCSRWTNITAIVIFKPQIRIDLGGAPKGNLCGFPGACCL